jgi:hypothetical protein
MSAQWHCEGMNVNNWTSHTCLEVDDVIEDEILEYDMYSLWKEQGTLFDLDHQNLQGNTSLMVVLETHHQNLLMRDSGPVCHVQSLAN